MDLIQECSLPYNFAKCLKFSCHKIPERVILRKFIRNGIGKKQEAKHHKTSIYLPFVVHVTLDTSLDLYGCRFPPLQIRVGPDSDSTIVPPLVLWGYCCHRNYCCPQVTSRNRLQSRSGIPVTVTVNSNPSLVTPSLNDLGKGT